jgi:hypothetical protein
MTTIPEFYGLGSVEISKDTWVCLRSSVAMVTIALLRGTSWRGDDTAVINRRVSLERLALERSV